MKKELINFIKSKSNKFEPLYLVIRGSHAYGTNIETSDTDFGGVFIQPLDDIIGNKYVEQINDDKNDIVIYEIRRFLELVSSNNPNILELLNTPSDCILYKHPLFDKVIQERNNFITKNCAKSFGGYASQQISKAKGMNKKQNWEKSKVTRKKPVDFCYFHIKEKTRPLTNYLKQHGLNEEKCGLAKLPHSKETYSLFYDFDDDLGFKGLGFENSNQLKLSSIPKGLDAHYFLGYVSYNKDGYTKHCIDYRSYQKWLKERNTDRWTDVKKHGQQIDGKNMMHCQRLLEMAKEISEGKGINVRRENAKDLIDIRHGKVDLENLIETSQNLITEIDENFKNSDLPDKIDNDYIHNLIVELRKKFYNLK